MRSSERLVTHLPQHGPPPAVVVGLDSITGLQTARILAARGVPVVGVVADLKHWGARTNSCCAVIRSALSGVDLVAGLRRLGERLGRPSVLFPCTDGSVATVSRHRTELADSFLLPLAEHHLVELLMDKVRFAQHAERAGLPVPRTRVITDEADASVAARDLTFPSILKPPVKSRTWLAHTQAKGYVAQSPEELLSLHRRLTAWTPVLVAQEWVVGPETGLFSCNAYFGAGGTPLATFVARKIRQWPPDVGTSASGEECRNDEVLAAATALFGGVGYRGLAYLEMKRDARTGRLMIIEPNVGRPTGRSAIAEAGGVELVHTAYCDAVGLPLPAAREQRYTGAKWVDLRRDLQAAVVARRRGDLALGEWARWLRGPKAHAIWSRKDPLPFLTDMGQAVATGTRMLRAAHAGQAASGSNRSALPLTAHPTAAEQRI